MDSFKISENIVARKDNCEKDGEAYTIVCKHSYGLPTRDITPEDLRALADRLENIRSKETK